jgi:hypothetical protein
MSSGLCNAAQTFQRLIDDILRGLDFCFAYIYIIINNNIINNNESF